VGQQYILFIHMAMTIFFFGQEISACANPKIHLRKTKLIPPETQPN